MPLGLLIGKGARNVRMLTKRSGGARFDVTEGEVRVSGPSQAVVNAAVQLLQVQFNAYLSCSKR
jgi:hypothetical protein